MVHGSQGAGQISSRYAREYYKLPHNTNFVAGSHSNTRMMFSPGKNPKKKETLRDRILAALNPAGTPLDQFEYAELCLYYKRVTSWLDTAEAHLELKGKGRDVKELVKAAQAKIPVYQEAISYVESIFRTTAERNYRDLKKNMQRYLEKEPDNAQKAKARIAQIKNDFPDVAEAVDQETASNHNAPWHVPEYGHNPSVGGIYSNAEEEYKAGQLRAHQQLMHARYASAAEQSNMATHGVGHIIGADYNPQYPQDGEPVFSTRAVGSMQQAANQGFDPYYPHYQP